MVGESTLRDTPIFTAFGLMFDEINSHRIKLERKVEDRSNKTVITIALLFLTACGTGSGREATPQEIQGEENNRVVDEANGTAEEVKEVSSSSPEQSEENATPLIERNVTSVELNTTAPEDNATEVEEVLSEEDNRSEEEEENLTLAVDENYSDEALTLKAYSEYARNNRSPYSAKIVSLFFKGAVPLEDGVPVLKEKRPFSFTLSWQNPAYAKNVNFYFFDGHQRTIGYVTRAVPSESESFSGSCEMLEDYRFRCEGILMDESKTYEGRTLPIHTSFVMAVCDRDTRDKNRVCDFIRIPVMFQ